MLLSKHSVDLQPLICCIVQSLSPRVLDLASSGRQLNNIMQTTTEDSLIAQKTLELCQAILDQPEFQTIRQQIDAFMTDDHAKSQYQSLSERGEYLQHKQSQGSPSTSDEIAEFEQQREAFVNNPVAKGFMEAQQEMHKVQESVTQYVTKTFELGRLPGPEDFESGSCGHGCGCH